MDAFELLKKDHKKVSQLFKEVEAASGQAKKQIFSRLKTELDVHANIEERIFYPVLENKDEARDITLEAYEEHKVVKDLLAELDSGNSPEDEWDAKLTVLKENVEHHVEEEEGELFSKARQVLSRQEIEELGVEMEAEKASELGGAARPEESTPSNNKAGRQESRGAIKESRSTEDQGVLKRLAKLVGLGSASTSKKSGAKRRSASKTSKPAASKKAGKKASKKTRIAGAAGKTKSSKTGGKAAKKSTRKSTTASRARGATRKRAATKKSAPRGGGTKKSQRRTADKRRSK